MKILEFNYTDAKGSKTKRTVIELVPATDSPLTIDVAEMSPEDQLALLDDLKAAKAIYDEHIAEIMARHDVKHNFRRFLAERMENIVEETY